MKHKVGDKVRIRSKEWYERNKNENGIVVASTVNFNENMSKFLGKEAVITNVYNGYYTINLTGDLYIWDDYMFEKTPENRTSLFKSIANAIAESARDNAILIEQVENGAVKISPIEVDNDLPIDTPVMISSDKKVWALRYYANNKQVHSGGDKSNSFHHLMTSNYIIPFEKFNPNDIEESLKYNIVK